MAKSYPRRDSASGIWRVTDIADNLQKYGTWPTSAGTRALFHGGATPSYVNTIDYVTIASTGDAADFGDMSHVRVYPGHGGNGNFTRSFMIGGEGPAPAVRDTMDYVNPVSTGDAADFGDLIAIRSAPACVNNKTRLLICGGSDGPASLNTIQTIAMATTGNAVDYADLLHIGNYAEGLCSGITGYLAGGLAAGEFVNVIQVGDLASLSTWVDFGDLTQTSRNMGSADSHTKGVNFGGNTPSASAVIDIFNMGSKGNAVDFGDCITVKNETSGASNTVRGLAGGGTVPGVSATIDYFTIATAGDAADFGDLSQARKALGGCSNGHGGLDSQDPNVRFAPTPGVW